MQQIVGKIKSTIFQSDTGFFVGTFRVKETQNEELKDLVNKTITITGLLLEPNEEEIFELSGTYQKHDRYGYQFQFQSYDKKIPEGKDALIDFLASPLIKGCGSKTAKQIVKTLGENALELIKENQANLLLVPGMTSKKASNIYLSVLAHSRIDDMLVTLRAKGFTMQEATKLVKIYQDKTLVFLEENIYFFKEFISFDKLDRIFLETHDEMDEVRLLECTIEAMERRSNSSGDTYYFFDEIKDALTSYFKILLLDEDLKQVLELLLQKERIFLEDDKIFLMSYYQMEVDIAHILGRKLTYPKKELQKFSSKLQELENLLGVKYNKEQKEAIKAALENPVSIISGGPGTGKTTIVHAITKMFIELYHLSPIDITTSIALIAPTGRAAKKLSMSTHLPAMTIHRYLKWNKDTNDFGVNEENKNHHKLIIVDETSMIDTYLFSSLLKGTLESAQIILVGDTFQLPSVGAGLILNDLVLSNLFSYTSLQTIYRQSENSYIPFLAKEIKEHQLDTSFKEKKDDYNFIPCESKQIKELLKQIIEKSISKGLKVDDIQVLAPMYKGENGIDNLNFLLQELFNPAGENKKETTYFDVVYREQDKVLQLVNNPDCNVYNGDIGYITAIKEKVDKKGIEIFIDFDGNQVVYSKEDLNNIKHAYAITIHKSQGSEFPHVILPISKNYYKMLYNKLIYTGVSRAKKSLVIIGEENSFLMAVSNDYSTNRKTNLLHKLLSYVKN